MAGGVKPTKLTTGLIDAICTYIATTGCYYGTAAGKAGLNPATAHEWRERGEGRHTRPPTPLFKKLAERVAEAEAERNLLLIGRIRQASNGGAQTKETRTEKVYAVLPDGTRGPLTHEKIVTLERVEAPVWQAAAWMLQRLQPEQWGKREFLELAGDLAARAIVEVPAEHNAGGTGDPEADAHAWSMAHGSGNVKKIEPNGHAKGLTNGHAPPTTNGHTPPSNGTPNGGGVLG
jgi:hypothetical protein